MILHNADLGPELAARAFPGRPDARAIALRQVNEDLGLIPSPADWLDRCDPAQLPQPLSRRLSLDRGSLAVRLAHSQHLGGEDEMHAVLDLLLLQVEMAGPLALPILPNGCGPALARAICGPPREVPGPPRQAR
jgi:hypothetical protein